MSPTEHVCAVQRLLKTVEACARADRPADPFGIFTVGATSDFKAIVRRRRGVHRLTWESTDGYRWARADVVASLLRQAGRYGIENITKRAEQLEAFLKEKT